MFFLVSTSARPAATATPATAYIATSPVFGIEAVEDFEELDFVVDAFFVVVSVLLPEPPPMPRPLRRPEIAPPI